MKYLFILFIYLYTQCHLSFGRTICDAPSKHNTEKSLFFTDKTITNNPYVYIITILNESKQYKICLITPYYV